MAFSVLNCLARELATQAAVLTRPIHLVDAASLQNDPVIRHAFPSYAQRFDVDLVELFYRLHPEAEHDVVVLVIKDRAQWDVSRASQVVRGRQLCYTAETLGMSMSRTSILYLGEFQNVHRKRDEHSPSQCCNMGSEHCVHSLCQVDDALLQYFLGLLAVQAVPEGISIYVHSRNGVYQRFGGNEWQDPLWRFLPPTTLTVLTLRSQQTTQLRRADMQKTLRLRPYQERAIRELATAARLVGRASWVPEDLAKSLDRFRSMPWQLWTLTAPEQDDEIFLTADQNWELDRLIKVMAKAAGCLLPVPS